MSQMYPEFKFRSSKELLHTSSHYQTCPRYERRKNFLLDEFYFKIVLTYFKTVLLAVGGDDDFDSRDQIFKSKKTCDRVRVDFWQESLLKIILGRQKRSC